MEYNKERNGASIYRASESFASSKMMAVVNPDWTQLHQ